MKKKIKMYGKRILCGLLAVLLLGGSVSYSMSAENNATFSDDFSSASLDGWSSTEAGGVDANGRYTLKTDASNIAVEAGKQELIAVSADTSVSVVTLDSGFTRGMTAYVTAASNQKMTKGYDFGIGVSKTGLTYARLYKRDSSGGSETLYQTSDSIPGVGTIQQGVTYRIKLVIADNHMLMCYINDVLVAEVEDKSFSKGYCGLRAVSAPATFDNFQMQEVPKKAVESLTLSNCSTTISRSEKMYFDLFVQYNSVYGSQMLNQDSEGVNVTGLDGTKGNKTVKVSYGGKTATTVVKVVEQYQSQTLFSDEFNGDFSQWNMAEDTTFGGTHKFVIENGSAVVREPNLNGLNTNYAMDIAALPSLTDAISGYSNFRVTSKFVLIADATTASARNVSATIRFAIDSKNAQCTFTASSNGKITAKYGSITIYSGTAKEIFGKDTLDFGKEYEMRADVYEGYLEIYLNSKLLCRYAKNVTTLRPIARLHIIAGSGSYSSIYITSLEPKGDYAVESICLHESGTMSNVTSFKGDCVDTSTLLLNVRYKDRTQRFVRITEDMISSYKKKEGSTQKVTISYAGKKTVLSYSYVPYMFYDTFNKRAQDEWITDSNTTEQTVGVKDNKLQFSVDGKQSRSTKLKGYVNSGTKWTNYVVSADIFFDSLHNENNKNQTFRLLARSSTDFKNYYGFELLCNNDTGNITGILYRMTDGVQWVLVRYTRNYLQKNAAFGKHLQPGESLNVKMELRDNVIKIYLDGTLMTSYTDQSEDAIYSGTIGYELTNMSGKLDNVYVQERGSSVAKKLTLIEAKSGKTVKNPTIYRGNELATWDYRLKVLYEDGVENTIMLTESMVGDFDSSENGKQKLYITYAGKELVLTTTVKERTDEVEAFEKALKKFDKKITKKNAEKFLDLKEKYDALTPWEASHLSGKMSEKYDELLERYDRYILPELDGQDLLLLDTFDRGDITDWTGTAVAQENYTRWRYGNGVLYESAVPYGLLFNTGYQFNGAYGNLSCIAADFMMLTEYERFGVLMNGNDLGYYEIRIIGEFDNKTRETTYTLTVNEMVQNVSTCLGSVDLATCGINLELNQWYNLRLSLEGQTLRAYLDDELLVTCDDVGTPKELGVSGLFVNRGDCLFDNVRVYGKAQNPGGQEKVEPTYYKDHFEDEKVGASPSHWQENYEVSTVVDNWKIFEDGGKVYGTKELGKTETFLHVFEANPKMTFRFKVSNLIDSSEFGIITRRAPDTAFLNIGYDHSLQKWYIESQVGSYEGPRMTYGAKFTLKENTWYNASVITDGSEVSLSLNNKVVVSTTMANRTSEGRLGFFTQDTTMMVDNLVCTFPGGDVPQDGLISYVMDYGLYNSFMEIQSTDDGTHLVGVTDRKRFHSDNAGLTWTDMGDAYRSVDAARPAGAYLSFTKLSNGTYLSFGAGVKYTQVSASKDFKNWSIIGQIVPDEEAYFGDIYLYSVHMNCLVEYMVDGHSRVFVPLQMRHYGPAGENLGLITRVYYSDDYGKTWKASENDTRDVLPGYKDDEFSTWAESKIVQCTDGTLRLYYCRNYLGCMQYTESKDGGVTWSGLYQIPELQCPMSSMAVNRDADGTYYMVMQNRTATYLGTTGPRNRLCLYKSVDGKEWEFLMNCEWMSTQPSMMNGKTIYQILDPSLYVTKDYVYITMGRSEMEDEYEANHQGQKAYYIRVEKDKLHARGWDASTVSNMGFPKKVEFDQKPQLKFGTGDIFTCEGTLKIIAIDGTVRTESISAYCKTDSVPDMLSTGKQNIHLWYKNGFDLSYEIEVVDNYRVNWNIIGEGTIKDSVTKIMEGETKEFTAEPAEGWRLDYIKINGKEVEDIKKGVFSIKNASRSYDVEVCFVEGAQESFFERYGKWIVMDAIVLVAGAGVVTAIHFLKKTKAKKGVA